jgi:hypothetical protein
MLNQTNQTTIYEQALQPRRIVLCTPDEIGYLVTYECGHQIWRITPPNADSQICDHCLDQAADQIEADQGDPAGLEVGLGAGR